MLTFALYSEIWLRLFKTAILEGAEKIKIIDFPENLKRGIGLKNTPGLGWKGRYDGRNFMGRVCMQCGAPAEGLKGVCSYCNAYLKDATSGDYATFLTQFRKRYTQTIDRNKLLDGITGRGSTIEAAQISELFLPDDIENLTLLCLSLKSSARQNCDLTLNELQTGKASVAKAWLYKFEEAVDKLRILGADDSNSIQLTESLDQAIAESIRALKRSERKVPLFIAAAVTFLIILTGLMLWLGKQGY